MREKTYKLTQQNNDQESSKIVMATSPSLSIKNEFILTKFLFHRLKQTIAIILRVNTHFLYHKKNICVPHKVIQRIFSDKLNTRELAYRKNEGCV